jgi:hypothetical protein
VVMVFLKRRRVPVSTHDRSTYRQRAGTNVSVKRR